MDRVKGDSTSTFRTTVTGSDELLVTDTEGCEPSATFEVTGTCVTLARFPNAVKPDNPRQDFRIYLDSFIQHVEIFIYNRSGELVYHCQASVSDHSRPYCFWDGTINAKIATIGTYPMIFRLSCEENHIFEELKESLLIIE